MRLAPLKPVLALALALLTAHAAQAEAPPPTRNFSSFNLRAFAGLVSAPDAGEAVLDIALDDSAGVEITFKSCAQVQVTPEARIAESQFALFRLLTLNCLALARWQHSQPARGSHFPAQLNARLLAALPAAAVPRLNDEDLARRAGKTLGAFEKALRVELRPDGSALARSRGDERVYTVMARADFDGDGFEDLLLRAQSRAGRASDLLLVAKTTPTGAIKLIWRP
ncbi:conserved exported hypothetical protein [Rubrivivax sp. A210]|uniref:hypothetical protein n=1 Tax=Rubrivivax sp. A210 TaxID=2772301 RepID=UPI00191831DF|nr:hypothetical protein [Rubrivivax sp. A210]CAD5366130.1 conserved exported hypothetical protein [Rubrivivax sp. A210]